MGTGSRGRVVVRRFYVYQATRSVGFISPIFTLFLLRDLSFTTLGGLSAFYSFLLVAGEIPTGVVGDRFGRRTSMALSAIGNGVSLAGFVVADSVAAYAVLYALWAIGTTMASGSVDAWLYETLAEHLNTDEFTRVRGHGAAVRRWTSVVTTVGGGALYVVDPTYPFVAAAAVAFAGVPALYALPASSGDESAGPDSTVDRERDEEPDNSPLAIVREALTRRGLRGFVPYATLVLAAVGAAETYVQPIGVEAFRATLPASLAGVAEPLLLGLLYAGFTGLSAVAAQQAGRLEATVGVRGAMLAVPAILAVSFVAPRFALVAAYPMFVTRQAAGSLLTPILNGYVNDRIGDAGRATTLSAVAMIRGVARVPLVAGTGVIADRFGATAAPAVLGVLLLLAVAAAAVGRPTASEGSTPA